MLARLHGDRGGGLADVDREQPRNVRVDADLHDADVRNRELLRERSRKLVLEDQLFAEQHDAEELVSRARLAERPGKLLVGHEPLPHQQLAESRALRLLGQRQEERRRKLDPVELNDDAVRVCPGRDPLVDLVLVRVGVELDRSGTADLG